MVASVNAAGSTSSSSSHEIGADTGACGAPRSEYAARMVRSLAFWL